MEHTELVKQFVEAYYKAQKHLDDSQTADARKQYYLLLNLYSRINKETTDEFQKELAYSQVTKVFNRLKEINSEKSIPFNIILAGIVIIILSIIVALNPGIVGLTAFQDEMSQQVELEFTNTTVTEIILKQNPLSFAITGTFEGESAKVFIEKKGKLELVFDTEKSVILDGKFTKACIDTCKMDDFDGVTARLFVEVQNGKLNIDSAEYHIERLKNSPPQWIGKKKEFNIPGKTILELGTYFKDPEGDKMVFLSTTEDGLDIRVENDKLIIIPKQKFKEKKTITVIASDLEKLTKVPIILNFE